MMKKKRFLFSLLIAGFLASTLSCNFVLEEDEATAWNTAKPLKDIYNYNFLMGNVISPGDLGTVRFSILKRHYNSATAENDMKPDAIAPGSKPADGWPWPYRYTQTDNKIDKIVDAVNAAGMKMHGHTLIWHRQTPSWLTTGNRETVLANLEKYVTDVTTYFEGRVISWDVVNEAMRDGLSASDAGNWRSCLRTDSPWYRAIGSDYIEKAFLAARKADPKAILFYNDYNLNSNTGNGKPEAVFNMVKDINTRYPNVEGRPLIDGIGMQSHHHLNTTPQSVEVSIKSFIKLGVKIAISEMDIMASKSDDNNLTNEWNEDAAQRQAEKYAAMFRIFKNHAGYISRVTFWGLDDGKSWRASSHPTLLDKNYGLKPAFRAVAKPDNY